MTLNQSIKVKLDVTENSILKPTLVVCELNDKSLNVTHIYQADISIFSRASQS